MVWVLVVWDKHETGLGEPLVWMTYGVSLLQSRCRQGLDEYKEDNIDKNPRDICLNQLFVFDQSFLLSAYELISPILRNSMNGEIMQALGDARYQG
jgi:hypothetical protein